MPALLDFSVQGSIALLRASTELTTAAAAAAGIATPLLDASHELLGEAIKLGLGDVDAAALVKVLQARRPNLELSGWAAVGIVVREGRGWRVRG